jgi:hypothetical protein
MDCREVRDLADSFLSEQLLVETNHELLRHLETCPACRTELAARRELRERLRRAFQAAEHLQPRPELQEALRESLRQGLSETVSRRSLLRSWWTLAAGVVLAAGGGVVLRQAGARSRLALLARAAAGDHQNCAVKFNLAEQPIQLAEAAQRYGRPYGALETLVLPDVGAPIELLARHACVYQDQRFGHLVFRYRGSLASLLVTNGGPPSAPELAPSASGPAVATLPAGPFVGFIVADVASDDLLRLAQAFAGPVSRHLS